jgi:chromosome segregation ATPase
MFYRSAQPFPVLQPRSPLAVAQFKYYAQAFRSIDFKKPVAFIRSAEEEISKLNPKKKDDAVKIARLREMVDERKRAFETLKKRRVALTAELSHIALYIRDNLVKIEKLCKAANAVLTVPQTAWNEEDRSIEDIKAQYKEQLRDALHHGTVTRQHLDAAKKEVAVLSKEISDLLREDISTLGGLYEAIRDHAGKFSNEIDVLIAEMGLKENKFSMRKSSSPGSKGSWCH